MIVVNNPGSWTHIYQPLRHASWHGLRLADLVFPACIFTMGATVAITNEKNFSWQKIVRRTLLLLLTGLFIHAFPFVSWPDFSVHPKLSNLRLPGVLQRLALVYFVVSILGRFLSARLILLIALGALLFYQFILLHGAFAFAFMPGLSEIVANNLVASCSSIHSASSNLPACLDRYLFGKHIYRPGVFDPEGFFSTLPSIVSGIAGYQTARFLYLDGNRKRIGIEALLATGLGWLFSSGIPVNKSLWSPAFVLFTATPSMLMLLALSCIDTNEHQAAQTGFDLKASSYASVLERVLQLFRGLLLEFQEVLIAAGRNAILVFVFSALVARSLALWGFQAAIFQSLNQFNNPEAASLLYALLWVFLWLIVLVILHKRKIYITI